jgi:hypothetical protein
MQGKKSLKCSFHSRISESVLCSNPRLWVTAEVLGKHIRQRHIIRLFFAKIHLKPGLKKQIFFFNNGEKCFKEVGKKHLYHHGERKENKPIGVKIRRVVLPVVKAEYHDGGDHTARHRRHDAREVHA